MTTLSSKYPQNSNTASGTTVDASTFSTNLGATDTDVQTALETIDELSISSGTDGDAIHDNVAGEINAITEKTTPVSGDMIVIEDSADNNNKKMVEIGNLPTGLATATTTIAVVDWTANEATKTVLGVTASNLIFVAPDPTNAVDYASAGIIASEQGVNFIIFTCTETPTSEINVNIVIGD